MNDDTWLEQILKSYGIRWPWPSARRLSGNVEIDGVVVPSDGPPKAPRGPVRVRIVVPGLGASDLRVTRTYNLVDVHRISDGARLARVRIPSFADIQPGAIVAACDKGVLELTFPVHDVDPSPKPIPVNGPS